MRDGPRQEHPRRAGAARAHGADRARRRGRARSDRHGPSHAGGGAGMKTLVVYLMAMPDTPELVQAAVEAGGDTVELGVPVPGPPGEGAGIRRVGGRALPAGKGTERGLEGAPEKRARGGGPPAPLTGPPAC